MADNLESRPEEKLQRSQTTRDGYDQTAIDKSVTTSKHRAPLLEEVIGGARLESKISSGGMGDVYKGTLLDSGQEVVVKILKAEHLDNEKVAGRFFEEAKAGESLEHPNIIKTLRHGIHEIVQTKEKIPYIMSACIPDSADLTKIYPNIEQSAQIILQIANALQYLHTLDNPIIHRDIKPANILINKKNLHAYLIDFGIQKTLDSDHSRTIPGDILGTVEFLSPEQAEDSKKAVPASDLYSLACTAYNILSRVTPNEQRTTNINNTIANRMNLQISYDTWLNEAIDLRRLRIMEEASKAVTAEEKLSKKQQLERATPVHRLLERQIMMILEAKDPKSRPPTNPWVEKLEYLINNKLLTLRDLTEEEKQMRESLQVTVEKLRETIKNSPEDSKNTYKNKVQLALSLENLADMSEDDDSRAAYISEAHKQYVDLHLPLRQGAEIGLTLDELNDSIAWLQSLSNYEQKLKLHKESKQLSGKVEEIIMNIYSALGKETPDVSGALTEYAKIDQAKVPKNLESEIKSITTAFETTILQALDSGRKFLDVSDLSGAEKQYVKAQTIADFLPEASKDVKESVKLFYTHIEAVKIGQLSKEYHQAKQGLDYFGMLEIAENMSKRAESLPPEQKADIKSAVESYFEELKPKKRDINQLRELIKSAEEIDKELDKEVKEVGEAALSEARMKYYKESVDGITKTFETLNKDNIGPKYDEFKTYLAFKKEDVQAQDWRRNVAKGSFPERMQTLNSLIILYNERGDVGNEELYILLKKKQLDDRLQELKKSEKH